jgi:long-chain acyl-CoA synthetase
VKNLTDHSESEVFVYSNEYSDIANFLRENTTVKHYININDLQELIDEGKSLIQQGEKRVVDYVVNEDILTTLMYTSGTTGNPKGVMLTHKGITKNCVAILQNCFLWESTLLVCPLYHGSGFSGTLGMLISGCQVAINTSLKTLPSDFAKYKPRVIILVPLFIETLYKQILGAAGVNTDIAVLKQIASKVFGGNLEIIVSGGAPLDSKNVDNYLNLGITILNAYGLTETSAIVSISRNNYLKADSVGPILPGFEVKIIDPDENGNGEILTKSEFTMLGYYKNEDTTAETIEDGWLKTGDIGYIDKDGFLYVSGRKKNMILLSNGKNVYPEELEFAMQKHIPYIKEVVVYASNEEIIAEVFLDTDNYPDCVTQLDKDILHFNDTQAIFKNINKTIIRDTEFPKTTTRKIKRQYK